MAEEILGYDIDGQEVISTAIMDLLNKYPAIDKYMDDYIAYATLDEKKGKAIFPTSGSAILSEEKDITGHTEQICEYPFIVIYRLSGLTESRREQVKEWLDNLGRWLEKQTIVIGTVEYKLEEYPALTRGRKFDSIKRTSAAFLDSINEAKAENWAINISAIYKNEF